MLASLSRRTWWLLALAAAIAWFAALDVRQLQHPDEGRYAEIAREMAVGGDWVTPRLNDLKYFEKPPLQYWLGAATFDAFGVNEWTARLPSAIAGFLAVIAVGFTARAIGGPGRRRVRRGGAAGTVWHAGTRAFPDARFGALVLAALALCAFLLAQRPAITPAAQRNWMLAAYAATPRATLTKGLVALVIPGATLVLYSLVTRDLGPWRRLHALPGLACTSRWPRRGSCSCRARIPSSRSSSSSTSTSSASSPKSTTAPAAGSTSCRGS